MACWLCASLCEKRDSSVVNGSEEGKEGWERILRGKGETDYYHMLDRRDGGKMPGNVPVQDAVGQCGTPHAISLFDHLLADSLVLGRLTGEGARNCNIPAITRETGSLSACGVWGSGGQEAAS
jgi:hypothetical protein